MADTVPISGVWLRRDAEGIKVLIRVEGQWRLAVLADDGCTTYCDHYHADGCERDSQSAVAFIRDLITAPLDRMSEEATQPMPRSRSYPRRRK